jgi:1,4-dihydroxy-2-naphthoyl-CoA synthase
MDAATGGSEHIGSKGIKRTTTCSDDMLATSPMGLRLTKDGLNISIDAGSLDAAMALEDRQQSLVAMTEDAHEAVAAFINKRAPNWQDR